MLSNFQLIMLIGLAACLTQLAHAHRCYTCVSDPGARNNCGEHFKADGIFDVDCTKSSMPRFLQAVLGFRNSTGCMKITTEVNNAKVISRACYFGDIYDTQRGCSQDPTNNNNVYNRLLSCDVCTGDLCNSATGVTSMGLLAIISAYLVRHFCF